jgi:1-acyl-sn-glycerol-3-phosphate acyltransferase
MQKVLYRLGRAVVGAYAQLMFIMDVVHHAPIPEGPRVIAANHPTTTDPFLITLLEPDQMSILISDVLYNVPLFGRYLTAAGHVPVVKSNGRLAFERAARLLRDGRTVGIFPEGAISPLEGGFHRPHTGAARLALSAGVPIIPVGIHLQRDLIRLIETEVDGKTEVGTWVLRGPYAMTVGEPLRLDGDIEDRATVRSASAHLMERIVHLAHESARRLETSQARVVAGAQWLRNAHKGWSEVI